MKILSLLIVTAVILSSCDKYIKEERTYIYGNDYGYIDTVNIIEITPNDNLNNNSNGYYYITKYVFKKEILGYDEVKDSLYVKSIATIGSLIQKDNSPYEIINSGISQLIDTNNIIKRDSISITYGINKKLIGHPAFSIYHIDSNRLYMLLIGSFRYVTIKVNYKGTLDSKEVAKLINSYMLTRIRYQWI